MKLYKPQVQLVRRRKLDEPDEYYLHSVTFCGRTSYRADGHSPIPEQADADGVLSVSLAIVQDPALPDFEYLTPVVHTISLGSPVANGQELIVEVSASDGVASRSTTSEGDPTTTVSSVDADEDSRPIGR
ncbi:MAG: hypothetical protein KDD02_04135 [Phaeodactylibacter sp.]|nr:hypothetical protein [Phaeodactylibacter sp.]MCB9300464.1 hypothetical protein [Lewinellaceae bacterium]